MLVLVYTCQNATLLEIMCFDNLLMIRVRVHCTHHVRRSNGNPKLVHTNFYRGHRQETFEVFFTPLHKVNEVLNNEIK